MKSERNYFHVKIAVSFQQLIIITLKAGTVPDNMLFLNCTDIFHVFI